MLCVKGYGLWCLTPLQQYFSYIVTVLLVEETGVSGQNHRQILMLYRLHLTNYQAITTITAPVKDQQHNMICQLSNS